MSGWKRGELHSYLEKEKQSEHTPKFQETQFKNQMNGSMTEIMTLTSTSCGIGMYSFTSKDNTNSSANLEYKVN